MAQYLFTSASATVGGVYLLDSATGKTRRIVKGSYRGLTQGPDGAYYVVSGYRNPAEDISTIHRIEPGTWEHQPLTQYAVKDSHDLRWIDGSFYLVASVGNVIIRMDAQCRELDRMQIVEDDRDICHVNCIAGIDGGLYVSIFTLSPGERKEKRFTPVWFNEGKILKLDYPNRKFEVFYEPLGQPHSIHGHEGAIYLVESHLSCVTRVDLATRKRKMMAQYTGFVRGMCFGPNEVILGSSTMYRKDRKELKPLPFWRMWIEKRNPFDGILVVDPRTWRTKRKVKIERTEVYDVIPVTNGMA